MNTTPTSGAASELLHYPWKLYPNVKRLIMEHAANRWRLALTDMEAEELTAIVVNHPTSEVRAQRIAATPPAPVQVKPVDGGSASDSTKESSREADDDCAFHDRAATVEYVLCDGSNRVLEYAGGFGSGVGDDKREKIFLAPKDAAPPPPDRVKPERAEAFDYWRLREWATMFADQGFTEAASDMNAAADFIEEAQETPIGRALELIAHAREWFNHSPHGDNCYVSDHYEGDPGNRCNCGRDSLERAFDAFDENCTAPPTDASGGVTEGDEITGAMWKAGRAEFEKYAEQYKGAPESAPAYITADIAPAEIYKAMRRALEAADRARKPVDASAQADGQQAQPE